MSKGPTKRRPTPREIDGIPGTVEPGFKEREIIEIEVVQQTREAMIRAGVPEEFVPRMFAMGPCTILLAREPCRSERRDALAPDDLDSLAASDVGRDQGGALPAAPA